MPDNAEISIIIPTYNSAITLAKCLDSIICQTYQNFEVWLIDGGSIDDTLSIIKIYQADYKYLNYISEPDYGIYDAMNKGIKLSGGQWLYFLGSDDTLYDRQTLLKVAGIICKAAAGIVYGNVMMRGKNQWNLDNVKFDGEYSMEKFVDRNICHQAMFYRRQVFEKLGYFNLRYPTSSDFDFNLRCFANEKFEYMELIIANFFVGGQSTIHEDKKFHQDRGALLMKYFGKRIFNKSFLNARLYLQRAALSFGSPLNFFERIFCLFAYLKLKMDSMLN